jgi:hypothetical protein
MSVNVAEVKADVEKVLALSESVLNEAAPVAAIIEAIDPAVKPYVQTLLAYAPTVQKVLQDVLLVLDA